MRLNHVRSERLDWELAVVVENEIMLFHRNGTLIESKSQPFSSLKALAYDNVRDQFIVSDMDMINDTIYTVQFYEETDTTEPIIKDLPGDVQGLVIDPLEDILYWTDAINHTINYVKLNETPLESREFLVFEKTVPHALAIDACNRYLYFTNPGDKPSIERIKLDKTEREILVDHLIMSPVGLAIDYKAQKLYWADSRTGTVAGRIESINLNGSGRNIVLERNTMEPFGLATDEEAIYFTDTNNNALYRFLKTQGPDEDPTKLKTFSQKPMGLVANNNIILKQGDCKSLDAAIKEYKEPTPKNDISEKETDVIKECLNWGNLLGNYCVCKRGFTGDRCENSICNSYFCLQGNCYLSSVGKPMCHCDRGFVGERCEKNKCEGFCLNGGECDPHSSSRDKPTCSCPEGFVGDRCEYDIQLCDGYCQNEKKELFPQKYQLMCRCPDGFDFDQNKSSAPLTATSSDSDGFIAIVKDPFVHLALILFCVLVIVSLAIYIRTIHKKRPRIKKRIIVNKNVTPLTYRPQPTTEQCEITIENCCNMNVCETPCFEPKEDKKKLLNNMEGDELY
ncbi:hypothetical protein JTB14_009003 [Gonioctena quinquepunctata]|nr:hypothetical protein JTB14_009003 [Gonioctena quinquepunctata]